MSISLEVIQTFIKQDSILIRSKDNNTGTEKLATAKKGLWSFITVKILKIENHQLRTITNFIAAHQDQLQKLAQTELTTVNNFIKKLNLKIHKFNKTCKIPKRIQKISTLSKAKEIAKSQLGFNRDQLPLMQLVSSKIENVLDNLPLIPPNKTANSQPQSPILDKPLNQIQNQDQANNPKTIPVTNIEPKRKRNLFKAPRSNKTSSTINSNKPINSQLAPKQDPLPMKKVIENPIHGIEKIEDSSFHFLYEYKKQNPEQKIDLSISKLFDLVDNHQIIKENRRLLAEKKAEKLNFLLALSDLQFLQEISKLPMPAIEFFHDHFLSNENEIQKKIFLVVEYYEQRPWLLFFIKDLCLEKLQLWLLNNNEKYPVCSQLLSEGIPILSLEEKETQNDLLSRFYAAPNLSAVEQCFNQLHEKLRRYILIAIRHWQPQTLFNFVQDIEMSILHLAFQDENLREKLRIAFANKFLKCEFEEEHFRHLKRLVDNMKFNPEMQDQLDKFFVFNYPRNSFSLSSLYKNNHLSDISINIDGEILKLHRVILRSVPGLRKFLQAPAPQIGNLNDLHVIKSAYDQFDLRNFLNPLIKQDDYHRSFADALNQPEDSDFRIESKSGEKFYLHKVILEVLNLQYFKSLFNHKWHENQESKIVLEDEDFEVSKFVFEYLYTDVLPEFEDNNSKLIFEEKLKYYKA